MGMIRILDYVDRCYNSADGQVIHDVIEDRLVHGEEVTVSFSGVDSVPSSFVNSAFISLLESYDFNKIKRMIKFTETNSEINDMIRSRFTFEANRIAKATS